MFAVSVAGGIVSGILLAATARLATGDEKSFLFGAVIGLALIPCIFLGLLVTVDNGSKT
jgi:hypothetical protein